MIKKTWMLLPFLAFVAVACQEDKPSAPGVTPPTTSAPAADSSTPDTSKVAPPAATGSTSTTPAATQPQAASQASPSTVPASLKSDGYQYEGLDNLKPMDMEMVISTRPDVVTGSQAITLKEVKNGEAVYSVERTGGLAQLGTEEWTLNKDGVFTTKSSIMDLSAKALEMPANPAAGFTWKFHSTAQRSDAKMDTENTSKIVGVQSVTTKAGTHKAALMVEQSSTGTLQGKKVRTESQSWYVKGLGLVKQQMKIIREGDKPATIVIQESKH